MKVLVTGYSGFLGRHLARVLKREGFQVRVILHRRTVTKREFHQEADEVLWGSLADPVIVRKAVSSVDAVVHAAWTFSAASERPSVNEKSTQLLLKASVDTEVKAFVFISSVAVYGMKVLDDSRVTEASPLTGGDELLFLYPSEKITCEKILLATDRKELRLGIFRPGPIFEDEKGR